MIQKIHFSPFRSWNQNYIRKRTELKLATESLQHNFFIPSGFLIWLPHILLYLHNNSFILSPLVYYKCLIFSSPTLFSLYLLFVQLLKDFYPTSAPFRCYPLPSFLPYSSYCVKLYFLNSPLKKLA